MERTKIRLMLDYPFFGSLALTMPLIEDSSINTLMTNGKNIKYNPTFVAGLSPEEKLFAYIHEICHVILGHSVRRGNRHRDTWNIACDHAVNLLIDESTDLVVPDDYLCNIDYSGKSAEYIYEQISDEFHEERDIHDRLEGEFEETAEELSIEDHERQVNYERILEIVERHGRVEDSLPDDHVTEEDIRSSAALIDRMLTNSGTPPSESIRTLVATFVETKIKWQDLLSKFMNESCNVIYNWLKPNRRYQHNSKMMMPSLSVDKSMFIAVVIDTSQSVDNTLLNIFIEEFKTLISSVNYNKIIVMSCASSVYNPQVFYKGENISFDAYTSGDGTEFAPAFEYISNLDGLPACIIYFTDLYSDTFGNKPVCPVLWIGRFTKEWERLHRERIPFGTIINME